MSTSTQCVFCEQPIDLEREPSVLIAPASGEELEACAHFRCYGRQATPKGCDGGD